MRVIFFLIFVFLFPLTGKAQNSSLVVGGLTLHGFDNVNNVWEGMPRKLDDRGRFVFTPTLGYRYTQENHIFTGTILKDCYDHFAFTTLYGQKFYEHQNFNLEWSVGLYVRKEPYITVRGETYLVQDRIPFVKAGDFQIIPIGFVGINLFPKWKIHPVINTNIVLTNLSFQIDF